MANRLQATLRRFSAAIGFERDWYLILIAAVIGILMGGVAYAFITPLHWIEEWAATHDDRSWFIWLVPIVPVIGALLAGYVLNRMGVSGRGPGVSTVLYSVHREKSRMGVLVAPRKWIASTLTIGSGGSAGAEGPIVTIGAAVGSNVGRWLKTNPQTTGTLLGCGAAAGIAAVFNAPFAGIFFVMEIILRDYSLRTFTPIVIAAVVSAAWTQDILGTNEPLFGVGPDILADGGRFTLLEIPNFLMLGLVCGTAAPIFVRVLFWTDGLFARLRVHDVFKPAIGAAMLGVLGLGYVFAFQPESSMPAFFGNGYPVTGEFLTADFYSEEGLNGELKPIGGLLLALISIALLKGIATCLTIGSGGAGGLFAPSLLMGAGIGGAFGTVVYSMGWFEAAHPAQYALVGMAAMIAAQTHAPLTGILIVYEITRSYEIILPLMLAAVIATILSRLVTRDNVYSWKLSRMGLRLGRMSDLTILRRLSVSDVPLVDPVIVTPEESAQRLLDLSEEYATSDFVVADGGGHYLGMVVGADLRTALLEREAIPLLLVGELQRDDLPVVTEDETLDVVLDKFSRHDVHSLAVVDQTDDEGAPIGLITRDRLMRRYHQALETD